MGMVLWREQRWWWRTEGALGQGRETHDGYTDIYQLTLNGCSRSSKDRSLNGLLRGRGSGRSLFGGNMNSDRKRYACRNTRLMKRLI